MSLMSNVIAFPLQPVVAPLRRPAVLIRAARAGQPAWRRGRDLRRLLRIESLPRPGAALPRLRAEEDGLNAARLAGAADYDMHRHVLLMIAILAESRALTAAEPQGRLAGSR